MWVIVTGANGGIGQEIVRQVSQKHNILAVDVTDNVHEFPSFLKYDITDLSSGEVSSDEFCATLAQHFPLSEIYGLVNNAAIQIAKPFEDLTLGDYQKTMRVNVDAPFALSKALVPYLSANNGTIINIGSIHSHLTKPGFVSYATSKGALSAMTNALAVELGERIRVNQIEPAAIETAMLLDGFDGSKDKIRELESFHPSKRLGKPKEVASTVAWLLECDRPFLNGATIRIGGGIHGRLHDLV